MRRFLITSVISIILYEVFITVYLLATDSQKLDYMSMSRSTRHASDEIDSNLAIYGQIKLIDFIKDADLFCVTPREHNPMELLNNDGIKSYNVDYSAFGFLGYFGWNSNRSYVSVIYKDRTAMIVEMNIFDVNENEGGCAREIILKFDEDKKEVFTFEDQVK